GRGCDGSRRGIDEGGGCAGRVWVGRGRGVRGDGGEGDIGRGGRGARAIWGVLWKRSRAKLVEILRPARNRDALDPLDETLPRDSENARGARAVPVREVEDFENVLLLHLAEGRHLAVPFPARGERVPENTRNRFHLRDHLRGEMVLAKGLVLLQEHDPLDQVPELPDVPGPPVAAQDLLHLRRDRGEPLPEFLVVELEEVPGQEQDVFSPFPKRRQENGDDLEPVVEILPEAALLRSEEH